MRSLFQDQNFSVMYEISKFNLKGIWPWNVIQSICSNRNFCSGNCQKYLIPVHHSQVEEIFKTSVLVLFCTLLLLKSLKPRCEVHMKSKDGWYLSLIYIKIYIMIFIQLISRKWYFSYFYWVFDNFQRQFHAQSGHFLKTLYEAAKTLPLKD